MFFPGSLDVILSFMKKFELPFDHRTLLWLPCSSLITKQLEFSAAMSENSLRLALLKVSIELASIKKSFSFIIWEIELQPKTVAEWMVASNKYRPTFEGSARMPDYSQNFSLSKICFTFLNEKFIMRTFPMQSFLPKEILYLSSVLLSVKIYSLGSVSCSSSSGFSEDCDNFCIVNKISHWIFVLRF